MTDEKNRPHGSTVGRHFVPSGSRPAVLSRLLLLFALSTAAWPSTAAAKDAPAAAATEAPKVTFTVSTVSSKRWTLRLENTGDVPLRIVADPYLLSLEVMVPAGADGTAKKPAKAREVRCVLPPDMRPSSDAARSLVLAPGKAYSESFDPRMYCFGAKESTALVRGARIIPHYGFSAPAPAKRRPSAKRVAPTPPFVVTPIPSTASTEPTGQASVAPLKEIIGAAAIELSGDAVSSTTITDNRANEPVATRTTAPVTGASTGTPGVSGTPGPSGAPGTLGPSGASESDGAESGLAIALPARSDGTRAEDLNLRVTLTNVGSRRTYVYFRPQSVAFDVTGPGGEFACPAGGAAAIRELFTNFGPRGRASLSVLAGASCPDHAFDIPGLYEVRPRLDTRHIVGSPAALHAFEGEVMGPPALVRIRVGKQGILRPPPIIE